jgi:hypothetical protein
MASSISKSVKGNSQLDGSATRKCLHGDRAFDASTTEGNSISTLSPVVLTVQPPCFATTTASLTRQRSRSVRAVPASSRPMSRL